ncbi:MAG: GDP-L-fucose synthase [Bacteroidia bacterium]|nr:GDP-L-fucose synthase [Bacteroidia bacterium]
MEKSSKIYVAGHKGLVGSAILRSLEKKGYSNFVLRTYSELNLIDQRAVDSFFEKEKPEYVFLAAAMVGGIQANNTLRADFIYHNIMIQSNVIHASWKNNVKKLLFLGSSCIYPKNAPQPLKEEYLLSSPLEYTNEPYAIAKIAGMKMCESFNIQYKTNFISVMPTNLYGPGDSYHLEKSHVLPALLRKIYLGKCLEEDNWSAIRKDLLKYPLEGVSVDSEKSEIIKSLRKYGIIGGESIESGTDSDQNVNQNKISKVSVNVWGTGTPLREFMYSLDMADACVFIMENVNISDIVNFNNPGGKASDYQPPHFLNIGTGEEISIKDLALKIKRLAGFKGEIVFDTSRPDGTLRKTIDISRLNKLGYKHEYCLTDGLTETFNQYSSL